MLYLKVPSKGVQSKQIHQSYLRADKELENAIYLTIAWSVICYVFLKIMSSPNKISQITTNGIRLSATNTMISNLTIIFCDM